MGEVPPWGDDDAESGAGDSSDSWLREVARVDDADVGSQLGADAHLQQLGRFRIIGRLGSGGMGVVYRAVDEQLHREVALKVLPASIATDGERRRRLLREARAAAAVTHPNIATVYEAGEVDGRVFVAMELIEGETLRARIERGPLAIDDALKFARQLLTALARAHDKGLVHRDLKPENVMIDVDGNVKVLDFGLAKLREPIAPAVTPGTPSRAETALSPTEDGRVIGTPGYMAPEQSRSPAVDARADLFSFGVIFHEMLAGVRPFTGATAFDVMVAIARDEPEPLEASRPEVHANIVAVVKRCLRKAATERFTTAGAALAAIEDQASSAPMTRTVQRRWVLRPRLWWAVATLAAGVALMVAWSLRARSLARGDPSAAEPDAASPASLPSTTWMSLTPSPTSSDVARAAYKRGMHALRDSDGSLALPYFEQALTADPTFASAQLQRCFVYFRREGALTSEARAQCIEALSRKGDLSTRDAQLVAAIAPTFGDPPDYGQARRLLEELTKVVDDAEVWEALGVVDTKLERVGPAIDDFDQERRVDQDAAVVIREQLIEATDSERAVRDLRDCVSRDALEMGCRFQLALFLQSHGSCTEMEQLGRQMTAIAPDRAAGYFVRAAAAAGLDEPREAIEALQAQAVAHVASAARPKSARDFAVQSAVATGDFSSALKDLESMSLTEGASQRDLASTTVSRAKLLTEIDQRAAAGETARSFLERAKAFPEVDRPEGDVTGDLLGYELLAGIITRDEHGRRVQSWLAHWRGIVSPLNPSGSGAPLWLQSYPISLMSGPDAQHALEVLPTLATFSPPGNNNSYRLDGPFGEILRRAGHIDDAIARLEAATHTCSGSRWPPDFLHLGQAYEKKGDTPAACRAYSAVLRIWEHARPKSITADAARARFAKLGCEG
jgi:serine/threonine protein kinase/tetratricopeptide (TPR) repeat protein